MAKKRRPTRSRNTTKAGAASTEEDAQLSVMLPRSVVAQVRTRAAGRGETLRVAVLRALAADGYKISKADLVDRRAETAKLKAELYRRYKAGE